jgi:hypothetical protein
MGAKTRNFSTIVLLKQKNEKPNMHITPPNHIWAAIIWIIRISFMPFADKKIMLYLQCLLRFAFAFGGRYPSAKARSFFSA